MGTSTLDLENDLQPDRSLGRGHTSNDLGPSDSSHSGSDMTGLLDAESDTDANGTGERSSVEMREARNAGKDIDVDRIDNLENGIEQIEDGSSVDDELNRAYLDEAEDDEA